MASEHTINKKIELMLTRRAKAYIAVPVQYFSCKLGCSR